ncbi:hypothetical protein DFH28DRAFT_1140921 [Melampsora americana]|nr:hypothetical protein DFH28DRAFT_1140921 [Melampsora americana]
MDFQTIMTATLRVTTEAISLNNCYSGWYENSMTLISSKPDGTSIMEPLRSITFTAPGALLRCHRSYIISGPFGQDPVTKFASIRNNVPSVVSVDESQSPPFSGCATLNGVGRVISFYIEEAEADNFNWNIVLIASHDYYDPLRRLSFHVIYRFGQFTPSPCAWSRINTGSSVWIYGNIVNKDDDTSEFVVNALQRP